MGVYELFLIRRHVSFFTNLTVFGAKICGNLQKFCDFLSFSKNLALCGLGLRPQGPSITQTNFP